MIASFVFSSMITTGQLSTITIVPCDRQNVALNQEMSCRCVRSVMHTICSHLSDQMMRTVYLYCIYMYYVTPGSSQLVDMHIMVLVMHVW